MRFGSSRLSGATHQSPFLHIQSLCLRALSIGHGVVRIPHTHVTPLDAPSCTLMQHIMGNNPLRCVIHAPLIPPHLMHTQLVTYGQFLTDIGAHDGVIICHMTNASMQAWEHLASLPAEARQYIVVELTTQSIDELIAHAQRYTIPIVFDWLHYHIQAPWPYTPLVAAQRCFATWGIRRPLIHLSSPDTADHGIHHKHIHGRHSAYLDWATHLYFVGELGALSKTAFDIEIEASAGAHAVSHFLGQCRRHTPPEWRSFWEHE